MTTVLQPGSGYPQRLTALGWRHEIRVRGALPCAGPAVAIVGARAASQLGMDRAHALARHLSDRGVHVVSGGALGIDGAAHRGVLARAGKCGTTTVVLGSGLDVPYPTRHARLFEQIVRAGGTLASLLPDDTQPRAGTFVQRNHLIAALSDVVIVVEADVKSGSLSTAAAGKKIGRVIAAWPGSPGCDRLLADGAAVVTCADDAHAALAGTPRYPERAALDPIADQVLRAMRAGARDIDDVVAATGLPARSVLRALLVIERYS